MSSIRCSRADSFGSTYQSKPPTTLAVRKSDRRDGSGVETQREREKIGRGIAQHLCCSEISESWAIDVLLLLLMIMMMMMIMMLINGIESMALWTIGVETVPPLEGFVMNRTGSDYFEQLLYKIFVSVDERTTLSQLAALLQIDVELVKVSTHTLTFSN